MITFTQGKEPGQWFKDTNGDVLIVCPKCGVRAYLNHDIGADGTVAPSLVCTTKGCDFHEFGKLAGYIK